MSVPDVAVYDHLRSTDPDDDAAVYRVVGTDSSTVTLLRVSDADGRRANTGEVITVSRDALASFESAENPDGNRSTVATLASLVGSLYWSLRTVTTTLAANPLPTAVALALVVAGSLTGTPLPEPVSTALFFAGIFALTYVGSGRL